MASAGSTKQSVISVAPLRAGGVISGEDRVAPGGKNPALVSARYASFHAVLRVSNPLDRRRGPAYAGSHGAESDHRASELGENGRNSRWVRGRGGARSGPRGADGRRRRALRGGADPRRRRRGRGDGGDLRAALRGGGARDRRTGRAGDQPDPASAAGARGGIAGG